MRPCSPTWHPAAFLATCAADLTPDSFRDGAALASLYAAGLRRTKAVSLRLADYGAGAIIVLGKGSRERTAFTAGARRAVDAWIAVRGPTPEPLLCPVDKAGGVAIRVMTPQAAMTRLKRRSEQAGIAPCRPHGLRRAFISGLLEANADLAIVQRLAGHASPQTTGAVNFSAATSVRMRIGADDAERERRACARADKREAPTSGATKKARQLPTVGRKPRPEFASGHPKRGDRENLLQFPRQGSQRRNVRCAQQFEPAFPVSARRPYGPGVQGDQSAQVGNDHVHFAGRPVRRAQIVKRQSCMGVVGQKILDGRRVRPSCDAILAQTCRTLTPGALTVPLQLAACGHGPARPGFAA